MFKVVAAATVDGHQVTVLEPQADDWLDTLAEEYRQLRTAAVVPLELLQGLEVSVQELQRRLQLRMLPTRRTGATRHLSVERSDLGELALAVAGQQFRDYLYGYRSVRDRELVQLPGRGIDQIGVRAATEDGQEVIYLSLGEAKVSAEAKTPPRVVHGARDSLHEQHIGHLTEREATSQKLWNARRQTTDPHTARLLASAAWLWDEDNDGRLIVRCTSMLVRPDHGSLGDAGPFQSSPSTYEPGEVDFMVLRVATNDIEALVDDFLLAAAAPPSSPDEDAA